MIITCQNVCPPTEHKHWLSIFYASTPLIILREATAVTVLTRSIVYSPSWSQDKLSTESKSTPSQFTVGPETNFQQSLLSIARALLAQIDQAT